MTILELRDVHRIHGSGPTAVHALRGVSLTVGEGELVAVMGPSGSGRSTLLDLAGGLDRPTRGEVVVTAPRSARAAGGRWRPCPTWWRSVGIAVVLVPLVAMLGAGLLTRSRLPIERRL